MDDTTISRHALTTHETALLEAIDEPCDVWRMGNETAGQRERGQSCGVFGSEQSQSIVLLRSQIVLGKELVLDHPQAVVSSPEIEITLLLGRIKTAGGFFSG